MGPICNHIYPFKRKAEGDVIIETGVMWSQAKECRQPPQAGRGQNRFSRRASKGSVDILTLDFGPLKWISVSWPPNCETLSFFCFKLLSVWCFVTVAIGNTYIGPHSYSQHPASFSDLDTSPPFIPVPSSLK